MVESIQEVMYFAEVIVIGNNSAEFKFAFDNLKPGQVLIDLVRIVKDTSSSHYDGICW